MKNFIPIEKTTLPMYRIGQIITILTNNGEELNATVHSITTLIPFHISKIILNLDKPYTLYTNDNYMINDIYDPVTVTATQPTIKINRTVLFYNVYHHTYITSMTESTGIIHNLVRFIRINHSTVTTFAKLRG